jgi:hypothetical protein
VTRDKETPPTKSLTHRSKLLLFDQENEGIEYYINHLINILTHRQIQNCLLFDKENEEIEYYVLMIIRLPLKEKC